MLQDLIRAKGVRQTVIAAACGVTEATVSKWMTGKIPLPADRVAAVSAATGIPAAELRPDLATAFKSAPGTERAA